MAEPPRDEERERKFGNSFFGSEGEKLAKALRDAQPAWLRDGLGIRGPSVNARSPSLDLHRRSDAPTGSVVRQPVPVTAATPAAEPAQAAEPVPILLPFFLSAAGPSSVLVADGKINGEFPSGMGTGDYVLEIPDPGDGIIYAIVTFDALTLAIDSRSLAVTSSGSFPDDTLTTTTGTLNIQIGFTYLNGETMVVRNNIIGDINFALVYGSYNSAPAILPVAKYADWLAVPPP